jgi:hypothetical protein
MGNTFGPNGFSISSTYIVSSSKKPKAHIKVTSQMRSPMGHADVLSREDMTGFTAALEADPTAMGHGVCGVVERGTGSSKLSRPAGTACIRRHFHPQGLMGGPG